MHLGDLAEHEAQLIDIVDQVDQHRAAAGFAPPGKVEIGVGLEPRGHGIGTDWPTQGALRNHLVRTPLDRVVAAVVRDQQRHTGGLGLGAQRAPVVERGSDRLFEQQRQPPFDAREADRQMGRVRRCDDRCVGVNPGKHLAVVGVPRHTQIDGERARRGAWIGDPCQADMVMAQASIGMKAPDRACTYQRDRQGGGWLGHRRGSTPRSSLWNSFLILNRCP